MFFVVFCFFYRQWHGDSPLLWSTSCFSLLPAKNCWHHFMGHSAAGGVKKTSALERPCYIENVHNCKQQNCKNEFCILW